MSREACTQTLECPLTGETGGLRNLTKISTNDAWNPSDEQAMGRFVDEAGASAKAAGLQIQTVEVRSVEDFENGFVRIVDSGSEGLITMPNGLFYQGRVLAGRLAIAHKIPLMVVSRETLEAGALMSYGPDFQAIFRRTAVYVDKILKGGKPAHLPIELPTKFQFLVNLKTAKALGVTISESVLLRADEVIEWLTLALLGGKYPSRAAM
jgi:putative tryptophan/tyrosine transport system substrate-binding protein